MNGLIMQYGTGVFNIASGDGVLVRVVFPLNFTTSFFATPIADYGRIIPATKIIDNSTVDFNFCSSESWTAGKYSFIWFAIGK